MIWNQILFKMIDLEFRMLVLYYTTLYYTVISKSRDTCVACELHCFCCCCTVKCSFFCTRIKINSSNNYQDWNGSVFSGQSKISQCFLREEETDNFVFRILMFCDWTRKNSRFILKRPEIFSLFANIRIFDLVQRGEWILYVSDLYN